MKGAAIGKDQTRERGGSRADAVAPYLEKAGLGTEHAPPPAADAAAAARRALRFHTCGSWLGACRALCCSQGAPWPFPGLPLRTSPWSLCRLLHSRAEEEGLREGGRKCVRQSPHRGTTIVQGAAELATAAAAAAAGWRFIRL